MKKNYIGLWLLLFVAFAAFAVASTLDEIKIGPLELKSSKIADRLLQEHALDEAVDSVIAAETATAGDQTKTPAPLDTASKVILFIGDSMLEGLSPRMADYAAANGHTLYTVMWYSSTSERWGSSDKLRGYIDRLHPDYVFICLGANELFVKDIKEKRDGFVRNIISDIGVIPYVWIGPPNWKPDTGINELIAANAAEGGYFKSDGMHFDRTKDGAHPTRSSAALWLDSVARWMPLHAAHPIKMADPGDVKGKPKRIFVHQPDEK